MSGKLKVFIIVLIVCIALIVLGFIGYKCLMIADIVVDGNEYYSDDEIADLAAVPVNTHVFNADMDEIKSNIESDPYLVVNDLYFEFPNTLRVNVSEERPVAFFNENGQDVVISESLKILSAGEPLPDNVHIEIEGLEAICMEPGQTVESENPYKISAVSSLLAGIKTHGMEDNIERIDVTDVNNIILYTDDGHTVVFGDGDEYDSKFNWLKTMIAMLKNEDAPPCTVDVSSGDFATVRK